MNQDIRIATSQQMILLASASEKLNRSVDAGWISDKLDTEGFNVLEVMLYNHNSENHHRVHACLKFTDQEEPEEIHIDVPDQMWRQLMKFEDFKGYVQDLHTKFQEDDDFEAGIVAHIETLNESELGEVEDNE